MRRLHHDRGSAAIPVGPIVCMLGAWSFALQAQSVSGCWRKQWKEVVWFSCPLLRPMGPHARQTMDPRGMRRPTHALLVGLSVLGIIMSNPLRLSYSCTDRIGAIVVEFASTRFIKCEYALPLEVVKSPYGMTCLTAVLRAGFVVVVSIEFAPRSRGSPRCRSTCVRVIFLRLLERVSIGERFHILWMRCIQCWARC